MKDVSRRVVGYWEEEIVPVVKSGKRVLVVVRRDTFLGVSMRTSDALKTGVSSLLMLCFCDLLFALSSVARTFVALRDLFVFLP